MIRPRHDDAEAAESLASRLHAWAEDPSRDLITLQQITADLEALVRAEIRRQFPGRHSGDDDYDD